MIRPRRLFAFGLLSARALSVLALSVLALPALVLSACGQVPPSTRTPVDTTSPAPSASASVSASASASASASTTPSPVGSASSSPSASGSSGNCTYTPAGEPAKPVDPPAETGVAGSGTIRYVLKMTNGDVTVTLNRKAAPCTVNSFVSLADQGFFDQTKCHRLSDSGIFILQCGDPTGTGRGGPGYQFASETTGRESYTSGVIAMANAGPGTNGSQFFFVWEDSTSLDAKPDYTIFATMDKASRDIIAGMAAEGQDGTSPDGTGRPNNPSEILSAKVA